MKLVSMSVYGNDPKYTNGVIENAKLMESVYPGWILRVYYEDSLADLPSQLSSYVNVELRCCLPSLGHSGMLWRFLPAWETRVSHVVFRDADSRVNIKEALAVKAWIESGLNAHAMHDHEHHRCYPLFGGMWGVKGGTLNQHSLYVLCKMLERECKRLDDMLYLQKHVLPQISSSLLRHSSVDVPWNYVSFPPTSYDGFVGQIVG